MTSYTVIFVTEEPFEVDADTPAEAIEKVAGACMSSWDRAEIWDEDDDSCTYLTHDDFELKRRG